MGTKTISITDAAYARLAARKRPNESFTDVIMRLTQTRKLSDLHKIIPRAEANALAEAIIEMREDKIAGREDRLKKNERLFEDR